MLTETPIVPYIPVSDVKRARAFYEGKLGLKPRQEYAGGVIYECGNDSWVFMYPSKGAGTSGRLDRTGSGSSRIVAVSDSSSVARLNGRSRAVISYISAPRAN